VFSMTDGLPDREPIEAGAHVIPGDWPQVSAVLSDLDAHVRSLRLHRQVTDADVRHARRESRRVLREHAPDLGVCESCRQTPATQRVVFADMVMVAVCTGCSAGAVGGVAA
jgi:hypothetical protein